MDDTTKQMLDTADDNTEAVSSEPISTETTAPEQHLLAAESSKPPSRWSFITQKRFIILLAVLVVASGAWLIVGRDAAEPSSTEETAQEVRLMGASISVIDGTAQISRDGMNWESLTLEHAIAEGDSIRTADTGRVIINLDDGSAVRVNSSSTVTLTSLVADDISIANENGEVYTRVVASDRLFNVTVGEESYTALGTAYKTINRDSVRGVEVYQSKVAVKTEPQNIDEGKRYYQANPTPELDKKVSDIPADQLQKDDFLKWNLERDKESSEFKDKLGYFTTLEKTPAPAAMPAPAQAAAGITLSGNVVEGKGINLSWKVSGVSVSKGFKIVKGSSANPTFGKDDAVFVEATARNYTWKIKDGKTYYYRVCVYNNNGTCTNYSNSVSVTAPYVAPPAEPTGSLSLNSAGGNTVSWVLSGSAPYGLKLVWTTNGSTPSYDNHVGKKGLDGASGSTSFDGGSGNYKLRICMYYEGTCKNYSNELSVTVP